MTAQLTDRAQAVIAASDEYTAPIFRAPSVGGAGQPTQINPMTFVAIAARHLPGDMDPSDAWRFFQEATRSLLGKEVV
jgi:hypothetical protein